MSAVRGYGLNGKSYYTNVTKPQSTWVNFTVTPTNGLGVTSVKSNGYANYVFMHTSTTPTSSNGILNPNPPSGYAVIGLTNNFNYFLGARGEVAAPATNTGTTSTTANTVYTITLVGTTTAAQWQAVGLPSWVTPTVGQTFVATATQAIGGTGTVGTAGVSNISGISVVGDPNQTIASSNVASYGGAYLVLQFSALTAAGTITQAVFTGSALATHTHDFTVIGGQAASTTNDIANYAGPLLGKEQATNATYLGANSATNGGVVAASAGTPAGTINAQTFTSTSAAAAAAPTTGSIVRLELFYDGSSVTIDGL